MPPDVIEEEQADEIDNIVPTRGYQMTPMVALGGSAGGIPALLEFFKAMPGDSGMVFVVVLHLSPEHHSTIPELLGRGTPMKVVQARDGERVQENMVYVIPPGKHLATVDGHLRLFELERQKGRRVAVDLFFRSLADTHGPHATAIVLSGADGDGAIGLKRIKERGGLTIAQDPDEAEHPSMPRAAIDTGMVDWVLPVREMPARLLGYHHMEQALRLPPEDGPQPAAPAAPVPDESETSLREVLSFLRTRTGRDFSYYKRATILRRISRRMQVNGVDDLSDYLTFLRTHPGEAGALLHDLLISVTNFFRDRDAFAALEAQIPELFRNKGHGDVIRVWVAACATGEEAYSIAMLLLEHARKLEVAPNLQVFACDLDDDAIQTARAGIYPAAITADVSEERLKRFFVPEHAGYRVRRELREMVLFAGHDLLKDPPFSRMDLVSCRNLLIYLNGEAQDRALDIFHFALRPRGYLFLGSSESVDEASPLFHVIDKKHRLYVQMSVTRLGLPVPSGRSSLLRSLEARPRGDGGGPVLPSRSFLYGAGTLFPPATEDQNRIDLADLHCKLIERIGPPSVIVNADYDIVHLSETAGRFLRFAGGELSPNLLKVVQPALRVELRAALFRVAETAGPMEAYNLPVELDGEARSVDLRVTSAGDLSPGFMLVAFEERDPAVPGAGEALAARADHLEPESIVRHLERELEQLKSRHRDSREQYEASTEELKASNEEFQAMNEELRSATEELETSREELQSINEELTTVNQELKLKVDELGHANSDLQNLMASTSIATIFLDRELRIMRFTPSAVPIFHLISSDVGRPLLDLRHDLEYSELNADAEGVLRSLVPVEREVKQGDQWFLARALPYRTTQDRIAGVVLTFVNITDSKGAETALRHSEERLRLLIESAEEYAIFTTDLDRRVDTWNSGAEAVFNYTETEILGQRADILFTPEDRARGDAEKELSEARETGRAANERWHARKDGSRFYGSGAVMALRDKSGALHGYVKIMRDLTERKRTEESLAEHVEELTRFNRAAVGRESRMIELKQEINKLLARLNEPGRYPLDFEKSEPT